MTDIGNTESRCSIDTPDVRNVLDRLHAQWERQKFGLAKVGAGWALDWLLQRKPSTEEEARRFKDFLIPLGPESGRFCYLVGRSLGAQRIVEFGTSFGVSTLYLAAAVKDNGGGLVIGSEIEPGKVQRARAHLSESGLDAFAEVREGDALETLTDPGAPVDLVLLDGWKDLYIPVLDLLTPHLRPGAVVLADNIKTFRKALAPYVAYVSDQRNGFDSVTLPIGEGIQYAVRI